jgi:hypothetical protein
MSNNDEIKLIRQELLKRAPLELVMYGAFAAVVTILLILVPFFRTTVFVFVMALFVACVVSISTISIARTSIPGLEGQRGDLVTPTRCVVMVVWSLFVLGVCIWITR